MKYKKTVKANFIDRPNRFIAHVKIEGQEEVETELVITDCIKG